MNELPRQKLFEIVAKHGQDVVTNPRRLEALLRDYCGGFRREISVLVMAVEEHAVSDLLAASANQPRKVLLARLARRLCDNLGLSEAAAIWSIDSWALALGIISDAEILPAVSGRETNAGIAQKGKSAVSTLSSESTASASIIHTKPSASTFIVSAKGNGDFKSIGEALRHTAPASRILVREGLYDESIVLDKNVEIIGEGKGENIIIRGSAFSPVVMKTDKALMRGLTLQGRGGQSGKAFFAVDISRGELILENCDITSDSLSGIAIYGSDSNPLIKNCLIHDCADSGFYIFDNARARIEDCVVYHNANVSVAVTQGALPALKNCRIFEGANGGIVIWGNGAAGTIENCRISGHRLSNVGIREYANPTFRRCEIFGGLDTGIFVHQKGYGIFEECDIHRNAKAGVGISNNANSVFRRCAIHDGENSGVVLQNQARASIEECNIYANRDAGVALYGKSEAIIEGCNINRNRKVAVRIKERSAARVENCDLRGNFLATWETEHGIVLEENSNKEG